MLNLETATALLRVVTTSAADLDVQVHYVSHDYTAAGAANEIMREGMQPTKIVSATTTTILSSPPSATVDFNAKEIIIINIHATLSNTVTLEHTNGTTATRVDKFTLAPGEKWVIDGNGVIFAYDATGAVKAGTGPGRLLRVTILTSGTSHTTGPFTNSMFARGKAGGGAGGGCTAVASAAAAAGGGAEGGQFERLWTVAPSTAYAFTIGAAGTGVSGAAGNAGGNTTITVGGVTATAFGGPGAPVATAATTLTARAGAASPAVSTNGDINESGEPGNPGVVLIVATPIVASGKGGGKGGGVGLVAVGNGTNGVGVGVGGGGAATGASAVRTGGNGTGGQLVLEEYS